MVNSYRYRMFIEINMSGDVELTHFAIHHALFNMEPSMSGE
ncbi:MAG: hypothetical protein ACSLEM_03090 [Candidatus Malihini olakiniferum]